METTVFRLFRRDNTQFTHKRKALNGSEKFDDEIKLVRNKLTEQDRKGKADSAAAAAAAAAAVHFNLFLQPVERGSNAGAQWTIHYLRCQVQQEGWDNICRLYKQKRKKKRKTKIAGVVR